MPVRIRPQENFARLVSSVFFVVPFLGGETRGCGVPVNQTKVAALTVRPLSELRYLVYLSGGARGGSTQQGAEDRAKRNAHKKWPNPTMQCYI